MISSTGEKYRRRSIRLCGYDYSRPGAYFITVCVKKRNCLFGKIDDGKIRLNELGKIVTEKWLWLAQRFPYVKLDEYVVMPNHFHGILWIIDISCRGGSRPAPTDEIDPESKPIKIKPVGQIIGAFKTVSAKQINIVRNSQGDSVWQRDFFDCIGRNENELLRIRRYIVNNPVQWDNDTENPSFNFPRYVAMPNPQRQ